MGIETGNFHLNEVDARVVDIIKTKLVEKHPCISDFVLPTEDSEISIFETNLNSIKTESPVSNREDRTGLILGILDHTLSMNLLDYITRHEVSLSALQLLRENL